MCHRQSLDARVQRASSVYSPGLGAFTQLDTTAGSAQNPLSMNRFVYAEGNPETLVDPSGHSARFQTDGGGASRCNLACEQTKTATVARVTQAKLCKRTGECGGNNEGGLSGSAKVTQARLCKQMHECAGTNESGGATHRAVSSPGFASSDCGSQCLTIYSRNFLDSLGNNVVGLAQTADCVYDPTCLTKMVTRDALFGADALFFNPIGVQQAAATSGLQFAADLRSEDPTVAGHAGGTLAFQVDPRDAEDITDRGWRHE